MDDVYGDLENYNDVNAIDELRNENKELKCKVEKYECDITKLQQDLDKLQSDYKKLETSYSSLLKTARAEVERKTQIINNLNQEKDAMVLNSLKNSDKSLLNIRRNLVQNHLTKQTNISKESHVKKNESERKKDMSHKLTDGTATLSNNTEEADKYPTERNMRDKNSESKENTPNIKSRAQGIRNRRKSMPVLSKLPTFSSDEELEGNDSVDESNKKDRPKEEKPRRTFDRNKHKVSETSGIDDKYSSHHESSRETYYMNRFKTSDRDQRPDKRTNRDKYESSRHRRNLSPECRRLRDHPEDSYKRGEGRHRVLESPPKDRSHDYRRARERRQNERRYRDRSRSRYDNRAPKHKLLCSDEPSSKRARNDFSNRQAERTEEQPKVMHVEERARNRPNNDMQNVEEREKETPPIEERFQEKRRIEGRAVEKRPIEEIVTEKRPIEDRVIEKQTKIHAAEDRVMTLVSEKLQEDSCQSPDHVFCEIVHVPKEIKLTATSKLEDPRLKSNRYIKTDSGNIVTKVGRNIDLNGVDISSWNIKRVPVPEALQKPPQDSVKSVKELYQTPKYIEKLRKHVYVDIENPVSNLSMSMESGEIPSDSESPTVSMNIGGFLNEYEDKRNRQEGVGNLRDSHITRHNETEKNISFGGKIQNKNENNGKIDQIIAKTGFRNEEVHKSLPTSFRIPKLNKTDNAASTSTEEAIREVLRESSKVSSTANKSTEESPKTKEHADRSLSTSKESLETSKPKIVLKLCELKGYRKLSPREIVAGDLELSDDTTEFIEMKKRKSKDKAKTYSHDQKTKTKEIKKIQAMENNSKTFDDNPLDSKKYKTKKKSGKSKSSKSKELSDKKSEETVDKNAKPKNKKETNKKTKFSELFGDSGSSLITPEDLGVGPMVGSTDLQPVNSYVPIFEDAQDADDINVKDKSQIQSEPTKTKCAIGNTSAGNIVDMTADKRIEEDCVENNEIGRNTQESSESLKTVNDKLEELGDIKAIYENLFPGDEDTKDTEVVKTEVLSTGLQPQDVQQSKDVVHDHVDDLNAVPPGLPNLQGTPLHALATSTPYKPLVDFDMYKTPQKPLPVNTVIEEEKTAESSCNSSENAAENTDVSSVSRTPIAEQSSVSQAEDVPDIRIFVKRRRRVGKKSL